MPGALLLTLLVATLPTMWPVVAQEVKRIFLTSNSGGVPAYKCVAGPFRQ